MTITSRYADDPRVIIDSNQVPEPFRHLIPLAKQWSIGDDVELESYFKTRTQQENRELVEMFTPYQEGLWQWHLSCKDMIPQPDELVLFDIAANAAASVQAMLKYNS